MNQSEKFISDAKKIMKYNRAENGGLYDGEKACREICALFERNNHNISGLASSVSDYWLEKYILRSPDIKNEPTEENLSKIVDFQNFLEGETENLSSLSSEDFTSLGEFVNYEAEDIPLGLLEQMMGAVLSSGVL